MDQTENKPPVKESRDIDPNAPYLIVGLGNPGREYRTTRHNIGFMVVDELGSKWGIKMTRVQFKAIVGAGNFEGHKVILAKPQTYMNLSGQAVGSLVKFFKIPNEHVIVVHDDMDLPAGLLRLRPGGGSAGQKGVGSIIERLGTQGFARMRMGIGHPPGQMDAKDYVLEDFLSAEKMEVEAAIQRAVEAAGVFITAGLDKAMNQFNVGVKGE
jgi:PTH1 family peptidyl-tRNA hydrolase